MKPGRPGRFFYRLRVHRRRKGERRSMPEADYAHLVTAAHHALNAPVILIWDGLNTHRSRKMRAFTEAREDWLTVIRLPGYAPDLNAVEGAWSVMKAGLGNHAAATLDQLSRPWSAAGSGPSSDSPTSSTHSSARPASPSTRHHRPWAFNLCMRSIGNLPPARGHAGHRNAAGRAGLARVDKADARLPAMLGKAGLDGGDALRGGRPGPCRPPTTPR